MNHDVRLVVQDLAETVRITDLLEKGKGLGRARLRSLQVVDVHVQPSRRSQGLGSCPSVRPSLGQRKLGQLARSHVVLGPGHQRRGPCEDGCPLRAGGFVPHRIGKVISGAVYLPPPRPGLGSDLQEGGPCRALGAKIEPRVGKTLRLFACEALEALERGSSKRVGGRVDIARSGQVSGELGEVGFVDAKGMRQHFMQASPLRPAEAVSHNLGHQ